MKKPDALRNAVDSGKVRGYAEDDTVAGDLKHTQYALKKVGNIYYAYHFSIEHKYMASMEDHEDSENIHELATFEDAIEYLKSRGAELDKFGAFKGNKPF